jgi:hypothetical protein
MSEQKKSQGTPARKAPVIPPDMKAFNEKLIADFRANHGCSYVCQALAHGTSDDWSTW